MKKKIIFLLICLLVFSGCSSNISNFDETHENNTESKENKIFGTKELGYFMAPDYWTKVNDNQWSNPQKNQVITMKLLDSSAVLEENKALSLAQEILSQIESDSHSTAITSTVELDSYQEVYQMYVQYADGFYLFCWVFEANDGKVHYIAGEANGSNINTVTDIIQTWSVKTGS